MNSDDNLPIKIFNYGKKEYIVYKNISNIMYSKKHEKNYKRKSTKYMVEMNRNKELIKLLNEYHPLFLKFIERDKFSIKNKKFVYKINKEEIEAQIEKFGKLFDVNNKINGFKFDVEFFKIKQSFLSYLIQNKKKLYDKFERGVIVKENVYYLYNENKLKKINFSKYMFENIVNEKFKVLNLKKKKTEQVNVSIKKDKFIINNMEYDYKFKEGIKKISLYQEKMNFVNDYDDFKKLLFDFFEKVNVNNEDNWDKYLSFEVKKLMCMDSEKELERLRK